MDLSGRDIGTVKIVNVEDEMRGAYLDYAMSVITARALPDARDGLKPVQRRILYAMHQTGLRATSPYSKSAATVGEVMKHFHPHGDSAIYDALVRMAQPFSMRYPLIDGQGNFGSVDDDPPAAMRYTEARMTALAEQMLADIEKNTVDFQPNYDAKTQEPTVLPSRVPNLLVNGASGIAVGMATNIPPHNLGEICDGLTHLIDHPDATIEDLMKFVKGPDFPTAGIIMGLDGIRSAFSTGHGRIVCQARAHIEELERGRFQIVVTELPYQVNKAALQTKIADLVKAKKDGLETITEVRDESDRQGMRVVIELRRDAQPRAVLNNLYKHTAMRQSFSVNALALVNGQPRVLTLKLALQQFLQFRQDVVTRRARFELEKARERAHVLEGLKVALDHLDAVIRLIRNADSAETARGGLIDRFRLTEIQAQAILDMQLRRLAALERQKILDELADLQSTIRRLEELLASPAKILAVVRDELKELKQKYGDQRRTIITEREAGNFTDEDLIAEQSCLVSITGRGYIKRVPTDTYRPQRRGTRGLTGMVTRESDTVRHLLVASTHDHLLFFTNRGRVFQLKTYEIPESSRTSKGVPVINLISVEPNEVVTAVVIRAANSAGKFLTMITRKGEIKKTAAEEFGAVRSSGLIAMDIEPGDELIFAKLVSNDDTVLLISQRGQAIRFPVSALRSASRQSGGVRGMRLGKDDAIAGADVAIEPREALIVTKLGLGKRTRLREFPVHNRGGQGVRALSITNRTGPIAVARIVDPTHDVMFISAQGIVVRMPISTISRQGRAARGVTVMRVQPGDEVVAMAIVDPNGRGPGGSPNGGIDDPLLGQPELFSDDPMDEGQDEDELEEESNQEPVEQRLRRASATRGRTGGTIRVSADEQPPAEAPPRAKRSRKADEPSAELTVPVATAEPGPRRTRPNGKSSGAAASSVEIVDEPSVATLAVAAEPTPRRRRAAASVSDAPPSPNEPARAAAAAAKPPTARRTKQVETPAASIVESIVDAVTTDAKPRRSPPRKAAVASAADAVVDRAAVTKPNTPARGARTKAKPGPNAPDIPSAEVTKVKPGPNAPDIPSAEVAKVVGQPKARTTSKAASAKAASAKEDPAAPPVANASAAGAPIQPPSSPSRKGRGRAQAAASDGPVVEPETAVAPMTTLEAPAKPVRTRRPTAPAASETPSSTADVEQPAASRRGAAPKPVPVTAPAGEAPTEVVEAAKQPGRRPWRQPRDESGARTTEASPIDPVDEAPPATEPGTGRSRRRRRPNRRGPSAAPPGAGPQNNGWQQYPTDERGGGPRGGQRRGQAPRQPQQQQPRRGGGSRGGGGYQDNGYGQWGGGYAAGPGRGYVGSKHANLPTSGTRPITRLGPQRSGYPGQPGGQSGWPYGGGQRQGQGNTRQGGPNPPRGGTRGGPSGPGRDGRGPQQPGGGRPGSPGRSQGQGGQGRRRPRNRPDR